MSFPSLSRAANFNNREPKISFLRTAPRDDTVQNLSESPIQVLSVNGFYNKLHSSL